MKKHVLSLILLIMSSCSYGQEYLTGHFAENRVEETTNDTIKRTYWQVLERAGISKKLTTYYRLSRINGDMFLDVKIIEGGSVFVVARNAPLNLVLEDGSIIVLHNSKYQVSCSGCGARGYGGSSAQGAMLTFPLTKNDIRILLRNHVAGIGINTGEDYLEKKVNETHSEMFMDELRFAYYTGQ